MREANRLEHSTWASSGHTRAVTVATLTALEPGDFLRCQLLEAVRVLGVRAGAVPQVGRNGYLSRRDPAALPGKAQQSSPVTDGAPGDSKPTAAFARDYARETGLSSADGHIGPRAPAFAW